MDCLRNYDEWSSMCRQKQRTQSPRWQPSDVNGLLLTRWAATGNDSHVVPLRLFIDAPPTGRDISMPAPASLQHREWHERRLSKVTR
jgi:hypothetical protein